jgi:RNA polymerase sigma factor (sigma-70 family)
MASGRLQSLMRLLRSTALAGDDTSADTALLRRFVTHRDDAAFAALVERHGPMVLGVCRRILRNASDAEDAFQAAFIVLACKARSIARPELLGSWLYRVAFRAALRARAATARRREQSAAPVDVAVTDHGAEAAELRRVLDEEIDRLPERFRVPLVLCCLEGRTNEEAARRLRCPTGTIASRLATARERLRRRLMRRGITVPAGVLATTLAADMLAAGVPTPLSEAVREAALQGAAAISATILAKGVLRAMLFTRIRTVVMVLTIVGLTGVGAGFLVTQPWANAHSQDRPPAPVAGDDAAKRVTRLQQERRDVVQEEFSIRMKSIVAGARMADHATFFWAALRLHESELDLCRTRAERIAACEAHLKRMQDVEAIAKEQFEAGKINAVDRAPAVYYRLDAEIRLERANGK